MTSISIDNYLCITFKQQLNEQVAALKTKVKEQQDQITQLERLIQIITQEIEEEKVYDC
jgi:phage shock protein A